MSDVPEFVEIHPLRSEGIADVRTVRFDADALTVITAEDCTTIPFADIAKWPFPAWLRRTHWKLFGRRLSSPGQWEADHRFPQIRRLVRPSHASVGQRWWHVDHQHARMTFFTTPRLTIWMPPEGHEHYATSPWVQIQRRLDASGFYTWDMT